MLDREPLRELAAHFLKEPLGFACVGTISSFAVGRDGLEGPAELRDIGGHAFNDTANS